MFKYESVKRLRSAILLIGLVLSAMLSLVLTAVVFSREPNPQRRTQTRRPLKRSIVQPSIAYSKFSHITHVTIQKLACDSCHKFPTKNWKEVRQGDAAFPDVAEFPEHSSCLNCHRPQFFARERPAPAICSNCHVLVTPRDTARFLFPSLGDVTDPAKQERKFDSEFAVNFPHDKHVDVVGSNLPGFRRGEHADILAVSWQQTSAPKDSAEPKSCPVCHQTYQPQGKSDEEYATKPPKNLDDAFWLKKGSFKTIPNSHTVCFSCHNVDLGIVPAPSECNACHKLVASRTSLKMDFDPLVAKQMGVSDETILTSWQRRHSSGTFRHDGGDHPSLSCLNCHNATSMNTIDPRTLTVPTHSCGCADGCHVTATADDGGILNYEIDQKKSKAAFVCTKCHLSFGKEAVPASHAEAIQKSTKK